MKRFGLLLVLAVTFASVWTADGARGGVAVGLAPAAASFPQRAFVLTLPHGMALGRGTVHVFENGRAVNGLTVSPARGAGAGSFGYVLALDASNSMAGEPLVRAMAAARAFAAERAAGAALGLVAFSSRVDTILRPSSDPAAIVSALDRLPRPAKGTRLRDAVAAAIALLTHSRVHAGSVVVLSDGADHGSRTGASRLVRLARAADVRVFTVGLRSPQFSPNALRGLATATGGQYVEAVGSAALAKIYRGLGHRLANEYLLRYRSDAAPGTRVYVTVRVAGIAQHASLVYGAPGAAGSVYHESWLDRLLRSGRGVALVALLAALAAAAVLVLLLRALQPTLRSRLALYVHTDERPQAADADLVERVEARVEHSLEHSRRWRAFADAAAIARVPMSPGALALGNGLAALVLGPGLALLLGQPVLLLLAFLPPLLTRTLVRERLARARRHFEEELPDNLQVLASALRAGHGLSGALSVVVQDAQEPARSEFERALGEERLGTPLEDALTTVAERMESTDLEQVALVAALHRETGGNTAEVLDRVHDAIRERAELRRMVRSLTAEGRMTRWILSLLPVVVAGAVLLLNRSYLSPLLDTNMGRVLLVLAAAMVVAGSLMIKRIIEIEV